jgi:hypothetical protein
MTLIPLPFAADLINDNRRLQRRPALPGHETDSLLIVDPFRMLSPAITCRSLQLIARRRAKTGQYDGSIHHLELTAGDLQDA